MAAVILMLCACVVAVNGVDTIAGSDENKTKKPVSVLEHISRKSNFFSFEFYKRFSESRRNEINKNVVFSPLSLFATFSTICIGAKGETKKQMVDSLRWTNDEEFLSFMIHWFQSISYNNEELRIASKVWIADQVQLLPEYKQNLNNYFDAKIGNIDVWKPRESEQEINDWVAEKTSQNILNLFPAGSVSMTTRLVLANAVYFKGKWEKKFDKSRTKEGIFCLQTSGDRCSYNARYTMAVAGKDQVNVMFMTQTGVFPFASIRYAGQFHQLLEMPYAGSRRQEFSIFFVLPPTISSMQKLERMISSELLAKWIKNLRKRTVHVTIPKFDIQQKVNLNGGMLNMSDLFTVDKADLSGINGKQDLYVSKAIHEAKMSVDEEGTVASGGTGVVIRTRSKSPEFMLNRPFLFYIMYKPTNAIIFAGKITNPTD